MEWCMDMEVLDACCAHTVSNWYLYYWMVKVFYFFLQLRTTILVFKLRKHLKDME